MHKLSQLFCVRHICLSMKLKTDNVDFLLSIMIVILELFRISGNSPFIPARETPVMVANIEADYEI